jgi:hypothetical protein
LTEHPIGIRLAVKKTAGNESIGDINKRRREHMKTLIGGAVAAAFGLIGLVIWWEEFFEVLAGIIPVMLLLGGGLAIYLGFDELKDSWKEEEKSFDTDDTEESTGGNVEKFKQEIDDLKEEIETLKKEKDEGEEEKEDKVPKEEK